jgi:hypothetical protein
MIDHDGAGDRRLHGVEGRPNCFPMIPSGAAHTGQDASTAMQVAGTDGRRSQALV